MQKLILFRQQIESLNDEELKQCITSFDRNKIQTLLFKGLFQELTHNKMDNINTMNSIISDIIQSRKPKTINNDDNEDCGDSDLNEQISIKLDLLPNVMISEISYFLQFSDQLQFEKTNRAICIGSRSSIKPIHSLNEEYFEKLIKFCHENKEIYLPKSRLFKSLTIVPGLIIDDYDNSDSSNARFAYDWHDFDNLFANIQQLTIEVEWDEFEINLILQHLSKCYPYHLSNLKVVRLINAPAGYLDPIDVAKLSLITRNTFEYIQFAGIAFKNDAMDYAFLKNLKGVAIHGHDYEIPQKISICDNNYNLESLHFDHYLCDEMNGTLNNLKELCLGWVPYASRGFVELLIKQNMKCLERIYFHRIEEKFDELQIWINTIMKTLKYIGVDLSWCSLKEVLNILDVLIESLGNVRKHRFKLRFEKMSRNDRHIAIKLNKLINILSLNCDHWMIICGDFSKYNIRDTKRLMDKQHDTATNPNSFVIKNKGCDINGYHENWSMECNLCRQHQR